jgi:hypothetical protein
MQNINARIYNWAGKTVALIGEDLYVRLDEIEAESVPSAQPRTKAKKEGVSSLAETLKRRKMLNESAPEGAGQKAGRKCGNCGEVGHSKWKCPELHKDKDEGIEE